MQLGVLFHPGLYLFWSACESCDIIRGNANPPRNLLPQRNANSTIDTEETTEEARAQDPSHPVVTLGKE